jgi:hypothetical protein
MSSLNLERVCEHEAGHFYVAYKYRPARAISTCISQERQLDADSGKQYLSSGRTMTFDPDDALPKVQVSFRAAGLAAESLVYDESFEDLKGSSAVRFRSKTDTDNAKADLRKAGLYPCPEDEFIAFFCRLGFDDAVCILRDRLEKVRNIAAYCLAIWVGTSRNQKF